MLEEIVRGRSLEEIRLEWSQKWGCHSEELKMEILEKPSFFSRNWKVKVSFANEPIANILGQQDFPLLIVEENVPQTNREISKTDLDLINVESISTTRWEENRYIIKPGIGLTKIIPCQAGEVLCNGVVQDEPFSVEEGDILEFRPIRVPGQLNWVLEVRYQGLSVIAKVTHVKSGTYVLPEELSAYSFLDLIKYLEWRDLPPEGDYWDEARLDMDLERLRIVYGKHPEAWSDIQNIVGLGEVVIAEAKLPIAPQAARLEDFVGAPQPLVDSEEQRVDFFASKIVLVKEGAVLARKMPYIPGVPGKDVLGRDLPVTAAKDFQFRLKKNVRLSDDGLEVLAACDGQPIRIDETTYMVENIFVLDQDVDLETGSIEFPGDVYIKGNVQDGLHIYAGGKVEILGAVSRAEIRAEKGMKVKQNVLGGKLIVGQKYVVRSKILRLLNTLQEELDYCLTKTAGFMEAPEAERFNQGQSLKLIIERFYPDLPKIATRAESYLLGHNDELVNQELMISVRTARHFLTGLGPLDIQAYPFLIRVNQVIQHFVASIKLEVPEKLKCIVNYLQGAVIESGGDFECSNGAYNSLIRADGDLIIKGVCRGGKVIVGGDVSIRELGGSEVSTTFVQISGSKRLKVAYCHTNVTIGVDKQIIHIDEACKQLEIYSERGVVQIEKLRVNPF
ncbi:MAG: FapA family protein [Desulfitobacteriaceae bacterium]